MNRDEFVQRMKAELDRWNAQFGEWEKKTREAQAGLREHYERHLDMLARQRAEAARRLEEAQRASPAAWAELSRSADELWRSLRQAYDRAQEQFVGVNDPRYR